MGYLNNDGLLYLWEKCKAKFVAQESGKELSTNDYTTAEKTKLAGIEAGATANTVENVLTSTSTTNALSAYQGKVLDEKISAINTNMEDLGAGDMLKSVYDTDGDGVVDSAEKLGSATVGSATQPVYISSGSPNPCTYALEKSVPSDAKFTDTTYGLADSAYDGLMSKDDYEKLLNIDDNANNYTHPSHTANSSGLYKVTIDSLGHVSAATAVAKSDITALGIPSSDTTYSNATGSAAGLMSAAHYTKLELLPTDPIENIDTDNGQVTPTGGLISMLGSNGIKTAASEDTMSIIGQAASSSAMGMMSTAHYTKLEALPTASTLESTYAKKSEITSVYKYKGSVASESALPTSGQAVGDVYDIQTASSYGGAGMNVVWTGSEWDGLGEVFTITAITNAEIDTICV